MRKGHFSGVKWKYASNNGHTQNKRYKILHAKHLIVQLVYNEPQAWKCKPKQTFGSLYFFVRGEGVKQLLKIFERSRSGAAVLAIEKKKNRVPRFARLHSGMAQVQKKCGDRTLILHSNVLFDPNAKKSQICSGSHIHGLFYVHGTDFAWAVRLAALQRSLWGGGNVSGSDVFKSIFIVHQNSGRYNHASFSIPLMGTTEKLTSVFVPYMKNEKCC